MNLGYKYSWTDLKILSQNWKIFSENNGGSSKTNKTYSFGNRSDKLFQKFEVKIPIQNGDIVFTTNEFNPLKIRFNFKENIKYKFLIYPEDFTDKIGKLFGMTDFEIGEDKFDRKFVIQGNSMQLIDKILNSKLRNFLLNNYVANFKLDLFKNKSFVELNISINELDYNEMEVILILFKEIIKTLIKNNNYITK